jgi:hypothetical protein
MNERYSELNFLNRFKERASRAFFSLRRISLSLRIDPRFFLRSSDFGQLFSVVFFAVGRKNPVMSKNRLEETQFTYKSTKDGKLFVYWYGKHVRTYIGYEAADILAEIDGASSESDVQYALARVTGNFKRGNEKLAKNKRSVE